jgi:hypothetical protein
VTGTVVLTIEELKAIDRILQADQTQLRDALRRMPSYQRQSLRWLARELGDLSVTQPAAPPALDRQRARRAAIQERHAIDSAIDGSAAMPDQKALLKQHVAHLWAYFEGALQEQRRGDR